ncbi:MAG: DUF3011 domain-containing protein [Fimbriimonas sp.]
MKTHQTVRIFGFVALAAMAVGAIAVQRSDQRITVESKDGRRARFNVNIPASADVRVARQLSDKPCREGRTWGHDRRGIWVDDGCRAVFEIDYRNGRDRDWPRDRDRDRGRDWPRDRTTDWGGWGSNRTTRVELESVSDRRRVLRIAGIRDVRLARQLSDKPCREGRTWGHDGNSIWVDDGCRAIFEVTRR